MLAGDNWGLCVRRFSYYFYPKGNLRSSLNDVCAALKIKPDHLRAFIRGVSHVHCFYVCSQTSVPLAEIGCTIIIEAHLV